MTDSTTDFLGSLQEENKVVKATIAAICGHGVEFFSFDNQDVFEIHSTAAAAKAEAERHLDYYRGDTAALKERLIRLNRLHEVSDTPTALTQMTDDAYIFIRSGGVLRTIAALERLEAVEARVKELEIKIAAMKRDNFYRIVSSNNTEWEARELLAEYDRRQAEEQQ